MNLSPQYIAGFLDGEGCIQMVRQRKKDRFSWSHRILIAVTNTYEPIVQALYSRYGGVFGARYVKNGKKKVYYWHLSGFRIKNVLDEVLPYLIEKKPQALIALEYFETYISTPKGGKTDLLKRVPQEQLDFRDHYYWLLRKAKY